MVALANSLLWVVLAACSASALPALKIDVHLPGVSLAIAAKLNATGAINIHQADRARAARLKQLAWSNLNGKRDDGEIQVTNTAVTYTTTVNIGEPATAYTLIVDTGSSNTWVGADKSYTPTQTSRDTGKTVEVTYGGGSFSGKEYIDKVDLGNGLVINSQSIGVAQQEQSFGNGMDGILGVGPTGLTRGSIKENSQETIPTVTDNLAAQGTIPAAVLGMFYAPYVENISGVLTFGGPDELLYTGDLNYVGITQTWPSAAYWGVDQEIKYGGKTVMSGTAGIVDSGTTLIMLPSDAYKTYMQVTGAVQDSQTGFLKLTKAQYQNLKYLHFIIGSSTYSLLPNGQIWPRSLNQALGGDDDHVYLVISDIGSDSGTGFDFINGYLWMERFYTVFDTPNKRIGFATTKYTNAQDN